MEQSERDPNLDDRCPLCERPIAEVGDPVVVAVHPHLQFAERGVGGVDPAVLVAVELAQRDIAVARVAAEIGRAHV